MSRVDVSERRGLRFLISACTLLGACAWPAPPSFESEQRVLIGRIFDVRQGVFVEESALLDELADTRFVLMGELHDRAEHHRLQARVLRELVARGRRPAVAFEMLRAEMAGPLDRATSALEPTPQSVRRAVDWDTSGWPDFALYEPVFAVAMEARLTLVAADLPTHALGRLSHGGLAGLDPGSRKMLKLDTPVPAELRAAQGEAVVAGHCGRLPSQVEPIMVDVQVARDANLARALEAADEAGGDGAVLIAGSGHVRRDWGVPWWLDRHAPGRSHRALAFVEAGPERSSPGSEVERFDYVWYTELEVREDPCEKYRKQLEALNSRSG